MNTEFEDLPVDISDPFVKDGKEWDEAEEDWEGFGNEPKVEKNDSDKEEVPEWSDQEKRMLKHLLRTDHLAFTRYFLKKRDGNKFIMSPHHRVMADTLEKVFSGEINRLIINVPPGYTKTEMAVINFIARGLAINPRSKFIHISYADNLAMLNSSNVKDIATSPDYSALFPMKLKEDAKSKKAWYNDYGGGMMAVASGGTITGFRAGRMNSQGFSGAMIIDDPIKPDDAYSDSVRSRVNNRFTNTFKSRLAVESVPIIVIMQRIHDDDPTGFLLRGGTGEMWHHLCLPVRIDHPEEKAPYPKEYTHGIEIEYDLPDGPLWEYKHTEEQIQGLEADPYTFSAQYAQRPSPLGGGLFKDSWWKYYNVAIAPRFEYRFITADTAQKAKQRNDYSVFLCWGVFEGNLYLEDLIRGKWEAPELLSKAKEFWKKHYRTGQAQTTGILRYMAIEDKASGTGLIQQLADGDGKGKDKIPVQAIQRGIDKVSRAMDCIPYFSTGRIYLPAEAEWLTSYKDEFSKFTPLMTHRHDDQIDPTLDAIQLEISGTGSTAGTW